jgi:glycosyltransferase involved in cell wall biosynthesis
MIGLPTVSIVTPSFNQARFLEKTIQSVLSQDYPHIEYILIDGGSTDGSVEIVQKYSAHLACWVSEPDRGQSDAIARGFSMASGDVFAWLNSDDLLMPSAVGIAVREFTRDPSLGLVYGDRIEIDAKGNAIGVVELPSHREAMFRRNFTIPQETAFFRRHAYEAVGGVDATLHFAMDVDLWIRLARVAPMRHVPMFLGSYRRHASSKSVEMESEAEGARHRAETESVYRKHFGRGLPSPRAMALYRLARKARCAFERASEGYRQEKSRLLKESQGAW